MCYLLNIAAPRENADEFVSGVGRGFQVGRPADHAINALFPPGFEVFVLTSGGCSCNMYSPRREATDPEITRRDLRKKYEKRGWSEAKIRRAIDQATSKPEPQNFVGLRPDVAKMIGRFARTAGPVGVLVHFDDKDERVEIQRRQRVAADVLECDEVPFDEDVLLWVDG